MESVRIISFPEGSTGRLGWKLYLFLVAFWGLPCGKLERRDQGPCEGQSVRRNWMLSCFPLPPLLVLSFSGRDSSPSLSPCLPPSLSPSLVPSLLVGKDSSPKKMDTPRLDISLISFPRWIWRRRGMGGRPGDSGSRARKSTSGSQCSV